MNEEKVKVESFEYKAEMKQLLHLIVHSLYTHPEIFLRELISNSSDALNKVKYLQLTDENIIDKDKELKIKINVDDKKNTFSIEDNGSGMTKEELVENIGTVAHSGTFELMKKMKDENKETGDLIGQFGVGFYSSYMVTDKVTIETRNANKDAKGYRWTSEGEGSYTIEEIEKADRGTIISFKLKEESKDFSQKYKINEIIKKYSNFADYPIYVGDEKVNAVEALWRKNKSELKKEDVNEFYKFITNDYEDPMDYLHLSIESAGANFKALLFIPAHAPLDLLSSRHHHKSLQLYTNKVMIMDDCKDLLPEHLLFIKGVVDTSDLPLNISREMIQNSVVMDKIKTTLTGKIISWLQNLADSDKDKYLKFYKGFGSLLKTGINSDFVNRDKLIDLLRFETSTTVTGVFSSLKEYTGRMKEIQKEIYFIAGDNRAVVESNPNLEYFKKHDIEVLYLMDPVDVFVVPSINEYDKKPIKSIDKDDVNLNIDDTKKDEKDTALSKSLIGIFNNVLKDKVEEVRISKRLVDSAVTLISGNKSMDRHMERMMKAMGQDVNMSKRIMEINMDHPLIQNLSKKHLANVPEETLKKYILHLFETAQLVDGEIPSKPEYIKRMLEIMEEATN